MKNQSKSKGSSQKVFRRTQWKFTFIISGITAVLLAVSFIAIYLFTMISNQFGISENLKAMLETLGKYESQQKDITDGKEVKDPISENELHYNSYECMIFVIKGAVDPEDYESVTYAVADRYHVDVSTEEREAEIESIEKALIEAAEENLTNINLSEASTLGRAYLFEVTNNTEILTFPKKSEEPDDPTVTDPADPADPVDPDDPDDPGTDPEDPLPVDPDDMISVSVYNKSFVVYDNSAEQNTLAALIVVLIVVFVTAVGIIFIFGYIMSGWVLKPTREAYSRQKTLVANASHELKTPITIINANLDVLSSNADTTVGENTKWLDNIEDQTKRMNDLIMEMLELSSFESAQYVPDMRFMNLSEELEGLVLSFEAACFERDIKLDVSIRPDVTGMFDNKGISKLALILLDNAIKYCNDKGNIIIKLRLKKKSVMLSVANTGDKIPPETMDKLFERFYKSGSASKSFGLGLSMAKTITENMHGKIACMSDENFTTFTVVLPL